MSHELKHENYVFWGFLTPFGALGTQREIFRKKFFDSAQLDMKIQLAAKFEKNLMDGYPAIVRTHARTDGRTHATENNSPSPINRGTKKLRLHRTLAGLSKYI